MRDVTIPLNALTAFIAFLLTHPVWDVTISSIGDSGKTTISTHTSRVGCDEQEIFYYKKFEISTHTSRVGCDGLKPIMNTTSY